MPSEPAAVLEAKGLTTGYDQVPIVRDVDVVFTRGAITAIIGTNGAGKSTVVKALVAEHVPQGPTEEHLVEEIASILWR